jgi:hypothetical protein
MANVFPLNPSSVTAIKQAPKGKIPPGLAKYLANRVSTSNAPGLGKKKVTVQRKAKSKVGKKVKKMVVPSETNHMNNAMTAPAPQVWKPFGM